VTDAELFSEEFVQSPFPFYEKWRDEDPIWWSDRLSGHVVSRYADVRGGFARPDLFRQSRRFQSGFVNSIGPDLLSVLDPPRHTAVRSAFSAPFRPRGLETQLRSIVETVVDGLVDELHPGQAFDLAALTTRLTMAVMAALMGSEASPELYELYAAILESLRRVRMNLADEADIKRGADAGRALQEYVLRMRDREATVEGPDLITTTPLGDAIDRATLATVCAQLLVAGVETTVAGVATTVFALLTHRDAMMLVRGDLSVAKRAFDEGLRWVSPVQIMGRTVAQSVTIAGRELSPGDEVFLLIGSANRDPSEYEDPDSFVVDRRRPDHLAFGSGIHLCLGAPLSRLEGAVLLSRLLRRFPELDFDPDHDVPSFVGAPSARGLPELWLVGADD
jgi:cytochrome P450